MPRIEFEYVGAHWRLYGRVALQGKDPIDIYSARFDGTKQEAFSSQLKNFILGSASWQYAQEHGLTIAECRAIGHGIEEVSRLTHPEMFREDTHVIPNDRSGSTVE